MKDGSEINQLHILLIAISVVIQSLGVCYFKGGSYSNMGRGEGNPCHVSFTLLSKLAIISNSPNLIVALLYGR